MFGRIATGSFGVLFAFIFYVFRDIQQHQVILDPAKTISGLNCKISQLQTLNQQLHRPLKDLRRRRYFRIFKVNLNKKCPFWAARKICSSNKCPVCTCTDDEVPQIFRKTDLIMDT